MAAGHGVNFIELVVGSESQPITSALFIGLVIALVATLARRDITKASEPLIPDARLSRRNLLELITEFIMKLGDQMMGKHNRKYLPFMGTIFIYLFGMNIMGLIPGFGSPTTTFSHNMGVAIIVFVLYNYWGIKEVGVKNYLKHLWGPIWWIGFLVFPIEIISHVFRPVTLSVRLFGNMTGDHAVLGVFTELTKFGIPVIFYCLGAFVSFMQAFVFTLLTMLYVGFATAHEEHH